MSVAKDTTEQNVLWVTEVWDRVVSHDSSLKLPSMRDAVSRSKAIIPGFDKVAITEPVWEA